MLTPAEIRVKAKRKYRSFLRHIITGETFFPLDIRFGRPSSTTEYGRLRDQVRDLLAGSKEETGGGYTVEMVTRNTRKYGRQTLPHRVYIANEQDYLKWLGRQREVARFRSAVDETLTRMPVLKDWLVQSPHQVINHLDVWTDLLTVCVYLQAHPRPDCYPRELPVPVHTKFVESHQTILRQLLDVILPPSAVRPEQDDFYDRFYFRRPQPLFRLRLLDAGAPLRLQWPSVDLAMPVSALADLDLSAHRLFIVENKMTFLTFPAVQNGIAVWGRGYQAVRLADVPWLARTEVWYWGDLDVQGFDILNRLREHWPHVRSFLMDRAVLERFSSFAVSGVADQLPSETALTAAETAVAAYLSEHNLRLEQERISQPVIRAELRSLAYLLEDEG